MTNETPPRRAERPLEPMSSPRLHFDLDAEIRGLWQEDAARAGRNARTLVKHPDFRIVLIVLRGGSRIDAHQAAGRISVQAVRGHIRLRVLHEGAGETIDLPAGHLLALERGLRHDVEAEVDSAFLLTVAWPAGGATGAAAVAGPGKEIE
jgi:quercetin dioxygenase-like cupin family protein